MAARRAYAAHARVDPEHAMLAEAAIKWSATESIDRKLGERLIAASREAVSAYDEFYRSPKRRLGPHRSAQERLRRAIDRLEVLVGKP